MATLSIQTIVIAGVQAATATAAAGGDKFPNANGDVFLEFRNDHTTLARTVTIVAQYVGETDPPGRVKTSLAITATALTRKLIGPFNKKAFNDVDGNVNLTYSDSAADVKVGVFRLPALG